ncbi:MAG: hypothetical protein NVSMB25_18110 [Thermoleophilaceae bacterium]
MVGAAVTISSLATEVRGTVEEIHDEGRQLVVLTDEGELMTFGLSPATGSFLRDGRQTGARLSFDA